MDETRAAIPRSLTRDVAAIGVATGLVGVSFGAVATATGLPAWACVAMSTLVFAGGSQFMAVGMLAVGNPAAAVLGGLLLNARHLPFGMTVSDVVTGGRLRRVVGAHVMIDESVAFALAQPDPQQRVRAYWRTGLTVFTTWNIGTLAGILLGDQIADPRVLGLDAAFPAALFALILPGLRDAATRRVALVAMAVAVGATFLLPAGLPVLLALVGLAAAGRMVASE